MKKAIIIPILAILFGVLGYFIYQSFEKSGNTINSNVPLENLSSIPAGNTNRLK